MAQFLHIRVEDIDLLLPALQVHEVIGLEQRTRSAEDHAIWRDQVIGWSNVSVKGGVLTPEVGFVNVRPTDKTFVSALEEELHRLLVFLRLGEDCTRSAG